MDALVETFRLAQCAVLQAQRDLIALRLAQEGPNSGGACGGPLLPKWSAQEQQQEAARLLEAAARQLDGIAHERADWIAEELRERSLREALAAHDDRRRLQQAMDEMAREFTNRTDTYVRQHEEFARHSDAREAALATAAAWANGAAIAAQRCIEKKAFALAETAGRAGKAAQRRAAFGAWRLFAARHIITREVRRVTLLERQSQCAQVESLRLEELCARGRIDSEEAEGRWGFVGAYFASAQRMARVEGIDATEQARRAWLLVKELNERAALQQCATIAIARQQRTNSDARLSEIGQLVVIYCARDALSRWRDFAERRRTHRRLSRVVEWFGAAAESVSEAYESKTELFVATLASHTWEEKHIRSQNHIGDLRLAEELTDRVLDTFSNTTAMWSSAHCECFMAEAKAMWSQNHIGDLRLAEELTDRVLDTFSNTTAMWSSAHCECFMAEAKAMWSQNHIGDLRLAEELTDRVLDTFSNTTAMWSSAHCECFMAEAKAMWSQNHIGDLRLAEELTDRVLDTFSNTTAMWSSAHCECFMAEAKAMWSQNHIGDLRLAEELTDRVLDTFSNTTAMWSSAHCECFMAEAKAMWSQNHIGDLRLAEELTDRVLDTFSNTTAMWSSAHCECFMAEAKTMWSQNHIGDLRLAEELTDRVLDTFSNTTAMWSGAHCECFMAEAKAMWSQNHIGDLRLAEELTDRVLDTFSNTTAMWSSAHCECFMAEAKTMWSQNHIGDLRLAEELTDRVLDTFSNTTAMWSGAHCECFMAEAKAMWSQNHIGDLRLAEELTDRVLDTFSNTTAMWSGAHYECFMAEAKTMWISQSPTTSACIVPADSGSDGRCFCSGSTGHCASRGTGTENVGEMVAGLKEPLQAHGRKGSPTCLDDNDSLEETLRMVSEERTGLAKRAREVVDVMRYNGAEALEAQRQRHKEEVEELLSYQRFLEQRIVGKKHVDCGTQTSENKDTSESLEELLAYQTFLEQKIAGVHCTDSGTQTTLLDYEGIRQEEELRALRAQLEEIQRQKQDHVYHRSPTAGQPAPELAQMHDQKAITVTETLVEVAEEYGRVLRALERDVDGRHAAFFSEVNILAAVERFSETLLSRCESDLETVSALGRSVAAKHISDLERKLCAAQHELGAARSELEEMRERLALCSTFAATTKHETETSALMATLHATRLQAEADISELKAQIDSVSREVREACEAHSRRESAALSAQIESLLTAMDRDKADFAAERQSLMDEADRLRRQIRDSEEHFERTAAQIQESSEHEIAKLQSEALQLRAEADASLISARQRQKEIDLVKMERAVAACRRESQCALRLAAHWASAAADSFDAKLDALLTAAFATAAAPVGLTCAGECPSPCVSAELPHSMHFEGTCDSEQRIVAHATAAFCFLEALAGAAVELIDAKVSTLLTAFEVALPFSRGVCSLSAQPQPPARQWERTVGGSSSKGRPLRHDATVAPMACRAPFPIITPPLQVIRADDVSLSMQRYSQMLNEQRHRNDSRMQQLDVLVMEVDDLIERGHAVDRLEKNLVRESPQR